MINLIGKTFSVIMIVSFASAMFTGNVERLSSELLSSMNKGVTLCISLLGSMCFWSGVMNVLSENGALKFISKIAEKPLSFIFSKNSLSQQDKELISASFAADFLGLGNAALPFGIRAMKSLTKNSDGIASDDAIMHAVLNTVPIQLIPATLVALSTAHGSKTPFDVIPYIWLCSLIINVMAIIVCKMFSAACERKR